MASIKIENFIEFDDVSCDQDDKRFERTRERSWWVGEKRLRGRERQACE